MIICFLGNYNRDYSRNQVLLTGLRAAGAKVIECHTDQKGWAGYWQVRQKYRSLGEHNIVLVGHTDSPLMLLWARLITRRPLVWDAFYSRYDTLVYDRKLIRRSGVKAWGYWLVEWLNVRLAHDILLDTNAHIDYFRELYGGDPKKYKRVLVGAMAQENSV